MEEMVPVESITVGDRARRNLGDLKSLAKSIEELGLLHAVVITSDRELVAGQRRLESVRSLGREEIRATILPMTPDQMLRAEYDENAERVDLRPSEMVALGKMIEAEMKKKVTEERSERRRLMNLDPEAGGSPASRKGDTRDRVGRALGTGGKRYENAKKVVEAAEADPDRYGDLPDRMDETGNVDGTLRELDERRAGNGDAPRAKPYASAEYRARQITGLASKGHSAAQIAEKLGIARQRVMKLASEHGIQLVEHKLGKMQTKIDPSAVTEKLVASLESNAEAAGLIETRIGNLHHDDVVYWTKSLAKSLRRLGSFRRKLERSLNNGQ